MRDPQVVDDVDYLILESTYGNRHHENVDQAKEALRRTAQWAYEHRGKVIIPSFAVGRTQEIVYRLDQLWEEGKLPPMDVYVDSPLAIDVTEVFRLHPECYDEEMVDTMLSEVDRDPLGFRHLRYTRSTDKSKRLNTLEGPAIIISASGMCEAGRILHHLKNNIGDSRNTVLFVGFQAENTLGRKLLDGQDLVPIFGDKYRVRARIERAEGYSAHADRDELLEWTKRIQERGQLKQVFLVHGEEESCFALAVGLEAQGVSQASVPQPGEVFEVGSAN